ncbi:hypothetical protein GCM10010168_87450 [Actinoplanes ianthinogenes]|uniref:Pyrrolo-quinoline quinone repeat domain-containing protein n=1 Tax=Actinoplanes ianthinogenes TaxID=122358 RepID=A0ABN6C9W7_9ACTN|nr:PQQ-binding-like beta-propeller repeat protein [Actinoplanes ianthinogenes]BCJ42256.1 hypothetical protein Aiant_29130 [Actinoplanes ianthinogenes]GGR54942.1 hypothetical protein GCM10010168_87450 [Actinoplanes ianthinogenes]
MRDVLIDLGDVRTGDRVTDPAPPARDRVLLALLTGVLTVLLGGAAHARPPAPPVIVPAGLGYLMAVAGDRLYVVSAGQPIGAPVREQTIRTYALPAATLLASNTVRVHGEVRAVLAAGADRLLVNYQDERTATFTTIALRAGVPEPLWERPAQIFGVDPVAGLALVREESATFRDADWHGIDLVTGRPRWTLHQPAGDDVAVGDSGNAFPERLYALTSGGVLAAYLTRTGQQTARALVPERRAGVTTSLWPAGDLVLISAGPSGTTGYDTVAGLAPIWHSGLNLSWYRGPAACGDLICAYLPQRGILVIDPRTGRERWSSDRWEYATRLGDYLLVGRPDAAQPELMVVRAETGDVLGSAGLWRSAGAGAYVTRSVPGEDRIWYGVLDPGRRRVGLLGAADRVTGDCVFATGALVCRRIDADVGVWRLK